MLKLTFVTAGCRVDVAPTVTASVAVSARRIGAGVEEGNAADGQHGRCGGDQVDSTHS